MPRAGSRAARPFWNCQCCTSLDKHCNGSKAPEGFPGQIPCPAEVMVKGVFAVASLLMQGPPGVVGSSAPTPANLPGGGKGERKDQLTGKTAGPQRPREAHPWRRDLSGLGPRPLTVHGRKTLVLPTWVHGGEWARWRAAQAQSDPPGSSDIFSVS